MSKPILWTYVINVYKSPDRVFLSETAKLTRFQVRTNPDYDYDAAMIERAKHLCSYRHVLFVSVTKFAGRSGEHVKVWDSRDER